MKALHLFSFLLILVIGINALLQPVTGEIAPTYFECSKLERVLIVDRFSFVQIHDTYHLRNISNLSILTVHVTLLREVENVEASDVLGFQIMRERGEKAVSVSKLDNITFVSVTLRHPVRPGENGIFTLSYRVPASIFIKRSELSGDHLMEFSFPCFDFPVKELHISVKLPEGTSYISTSLASPRVEESAYKGTTISSTTIYEEPSILSQPFFVEYRYSIFWATFYPTIWIGLSLSIICSILVISKAMRVPIPKPPIPVKTAFDFLHAYDKKLSLTEELDSLEERWRKKKVKRYEYESRKKSIRQSLSLLSKDLASLKTRVRGLGRRYSDIISEVEVSEARIEVIRADMRRAEEQYRLGKMSKVAYQELMSDLAKELDRRYAAIRKALMELREEVS